MNKIDTFSIQDVVKLHPPEKHEYVFGSPFDSLSDDEMRQCKFQYSLILIQVRKLTVHIRKNGSKADFEYNGKTYKDIRITDPDYAQADLTYSTSIGKAYLVVSMPARPDVRRSGRWYKFVAKIYL